MDILHYESGCGDVCSDGFSNCFIVMSHIYSVWRRPAGCTYFGHAYVRDCPSVRPYKPTNCRPHGPSRHSIDIAVTSLWARWRLKSPAFPLCAQPFVRRSKKTSKLRVTGLCEGNSPVTGEFSAQRVGNAEKASIWWRHHACDSHQANLK